MANVDYLVAKINSAATDLVAHYEAEMQTMQRAFEAVSSTFAPLHQVAKSFVEFPSFMQSGENPSLAAIQLFELKARDVITAARAELERVNKLNAPIQEHNQNVVRQVTAFMTRLGILPTYSTYDYPTPRSRNKSQQTRSAGYVQDLQRCMPRTNAQDCRYSVDEFERRANVAISTAKKKLNDAQATKFETDILMFMSSKPWQDAGPLIPNEELEVLAKHSDVSEKLIQRIKFMLQNESTRIVSRFGGEGENFSPELAVNNMPEYLRFLAVRSALALANRIFVE